MQGSSGAAPPGAPAPPQACTTPLAKTPCLMAAQAPTPCDKHRPPGRSAGRAVRAATGVVVAGAYSADKGMPLQTPARSDRQPFAERHIQPHTALVQGDRGPPRKLQTRSYAPPLVNAAAPHAPTLAQPVPPQSGQHVHAASSYAPPPTHAATSYIPPPERSASFVPPAVATASSFSYKPPVVSARAASAALSPAMGTPSPSGIHFSGFSSPVHGSGMCKTFGRLPSAHAVPASWGVAAYVQAAYAGGA